MTDTPPAVARRYRAMLLAKPGAERVAMASAMFDTARRLVLASLPPNLTPAETRARLLARTYPEIAASQPPPGCSCAAR